MIIYDLVSSHRVRLHPFVPLITLSLWRNRDNTWISVTSTHAQKTPVHNDADVPQPSGYHQSSAEDALKAVINGFRSMVAEAVEAGYTPAEDWLVPEV